MGGNISETWFREDTLL